jgi:tetratricopeptide (TPR) repeat protein
MQYGTAQNNLGNAYRTLTEVEGKAENSKRAIEAYDEALEVYTRDRFPMDYAMTQNNLGNAYGTLGEVEGKVENSKRAIEAYEEALKIYTESEYPEIFPVVERNLKILRDFCGGD